MCIGNIPLIKTSRERERTKHRRFADSSSKGLEEYKKQIFACWSGFNAKRAPGVGGRVAEKLKEIRIRNARKAFSPKKRKKKKKESNLQSSFFGEEEGVRKENI